ncbi:HAD family hydrolase [Ciceribacter sp. L1K23]|uniref:HAD family hydrolase n=1 Tax=unclassified Ciceribacter TaxID=2628820 RepID=UPI001ABE35C5|nr:MULTISPECIES: HAD family hydrolase [unclassified Ciceribacter]MBO3759044.1 HAD family hydrolase [Ciceribacter sp. L1K22]MBR0556809.1 HAD family hydrolase [Ciceribacter sp. L1K23]
MTILKDTALPRDERLSSIEGILFDKDGTLLDFDDSWGPVNREVALLASGGDAALASTLLRACGMDPETGHIVPDSLLAAGNTREIAAGFVSAGSLLDVEWLVPRIDAMFAGAAEKSVPVTDLAELFATLSRRGLRLGIASSDNELSIRRTAERFSLTPYVDFIAGYDSGHGVKPQPGMVLGFCAATGLDPARVAVVGDNNHDLHMGRNAGVGLKIAVLSGTGSRDSLSACCDIMVDDVSHLPGLFSVQAGEV